MNMYEDIFGSEMGELKRHQKVLKQSEFCHFESCPYSLYVYRIDRRGDKEIMHE